jgi:hypothetical protein
MTRHLPRRRAIVLDRSFCSAPLGPQAHGTFVPNPPRASIQQSQHQLVLPLILGQKKEENPTYARKIQHMTLCSSDNLQRRMRAVIGYQQARFAL